jgi:3,4-dihydroxy-2-butanone 4-phosphate synthase
MSHERSKPSSKATPFVFLTPKSEKGKPTSSSPAPPHFPRTCANFAKIAGGFSFWLLATKSENNSHTTNEAVESFPVLGHLITNDLRYDARSAFTLSLNHRETYTGITDHDRALTTRRFAELAADCMKEGASVETGMKRLGAEFRTPGHIPICREAKGGLARRQGHTELAVGLARLAGMTPVVIGAEMLQSDGDLALSVNDARAWAQQRDIPFIEGADLIQALGLDG